MTLTDHCEEIAGDISLPYAREHTTNSRIYTRTLINTTRTLGFGAPLNWSISKLHSTHLLTQPKKKIWVSFKSTGHMLWKILSNSQRKWGPIGHCGGYWRVKMAHLVLIRSCARCKLKWAVSFIVCKYFVQCTWKVLSSVWQARH
jgi:hypothetical protein